MQGLLIIMYHSGDMFGWKKEAMPCNGSEKVPDARRGIIF